MDYHSFPFSRPQWPRFSFILSRVDFEVIFSTFKRGHQNYFQLVTEVTRKGNYERFLQNIEVVKKKERCNSNYGLITDFECKYIHVCSLYICIPFSPYVYKQLYKAREV